MTSNDLTRKLRIPAPTSAFRKRPIAEKIRPMPRNKKMINRTRGMHLGMNPQRNSVKY